MGIDMPPVIAMSGPKNNLIRLAIRKIEFQKIEIAFTLISRKATGVAMSDRKILDAIFVRWALVESKVVMGAVCGSPTFENFGE